jgi:hypothetical protein
MSTTKAKVTAYVDPVVQRSLKVAAARQGVSESELVDRALREQLGLAVVGEAQELSRMTADEAMRAAVDEVRSYRRTNPITR